MSVVFRVPTNLPETPKIKPIDENALRLEEADYKRRKFWLKIFSIVGIALAILFVVACSIASLVFNSNLAAQLRWGCLATGDLARSNSSGIVLGEMNMDRSGPSINYRFQSHGLSSGIKDIIVKGPIEPGWFDSSVNLFTLCGMVSGCNPCVPVDGVLTDTLYNRCDDGTGLGTKFSQILAAPSRFYIQVNTMFLPSGDGEVRCYLIGVAGWAQ